MAESEVVGMSGDYLILEKSEDDACNDFKFGVIHIDGDFFIAHCTNKIKAMHVARALDTMDKADMLAAESYRVQGIKAMFKKEFDMEV